MLINSTISMVESRKAAKVVTPLFRWPLLNRTIRAVQVILINAVDAVISLISLIAASWEVDRISAEAWSDCEAAESTDTMVLKPDTGRCPAVVTA